MKVYLATLGCKLNESELEDWSRRMASDGHEIVTDPQQAELFVLNTCTVTHTAARKSRQLARQLVRGNPNARLILTGCYATISHKEASSLPNVSLVVPNCDKDRLVELAGGLSGDIRFLTTATGCRLPEAASGELLEHGENSPAETGDLAQPIAGAHLRTRAFVKVMDGCNMSCTYCIIPIARGKEQSQPLGKIVDQVKSLVNSGYQEIILTGVQISVYENNGDKAHGLRDLVAAILSETSVPRLRLTSIAPWDLDESLLDLWMDSRLCRHIHLSLQSGSDTVLRRMRRAYTTAQFARVADLARAKIPDVGITTDVIVGFPGESDVEFEQSLGFVEAMRFSRVHVFPYSAREGTVAAHLPLPVSEPVKQARAHQMQKLADESALEFARRFVGRDLLVLWETQELAETKAAQVPASPVWSGYTDNYIRVFAPSDADLTNRIVTTRLVAVGKDGMLGSFDDSHYPDSGFRED